MQEQIIELQEEQVNRTTKKNRVVIVIAIIAILAALLFLFIVLGRFEGYEAEGVVNLENAQRTQYSDFSGDLLSYNLDGAFLMDYSGNLIWNVGYEMQDPQIDKGNTCALIYDKQGTLMKIISKEGIEGTIRTTLPITAASVSEKKTVAVIMQDKDVAHVQLYKQNGDVIATGELNLTDSGYPMALALSSDGRMMAISTIHLLEGVVKSEIIFFDFSSDEHIYENKKVGTYSYSDMVIPQIRYVNNDKLLAFGDSEIMIFGNQAEPKLEHEIFFTEEIKSIFFNNKYAGVIVNETLEDGEIVNCIKVYNLNGSKRLSKTIEGSYTYCEMLDNNEVFMTDGKSVNIYTLLGVKKFNYQFGEEIQKVIPGVGYKSYYLFRDKEMVKIKLR